jgi:hypothetical protein
MRHHHLTQLRVDLEIDDGGVADATHLLYARDAIDVTKHKVAAKTAVDSHRTLQVHATSFTPFADRRPRERGLHRRDFEPPRTVGNDGQARTIHRDAFSIREILVPGCDAKAAASGGSGHALDESHVVHESGEHVKQLRERTRS